jgi:hypothetical protein
MLYLLHIVFLTTMYQKSQLTTVYNITKYHGTKSKRLCSDL